MRVLSSSSSYDGEDVSVLSSFSTDDGEDADDDGDGSDDGDDNNGGNNSAYAGTYGIGRGQQGGATLNPNYYTTQDSNSSNDYSSGHDN